MLLRGGMALCGGFFKPCQCAGLSRYAATCLYCCMVRSQRTIDFSTTLFSTDTVAIISLQIYKFVSLYFSRHSMQGATPEACALLFSAAWEQNPFTEEFRSEISMTAPKSSAGNVRMLFPPVPASDRRKTLPAGSPPSPPDCRRPSGTHPGYRLATPR